MCIRLYLTGKLASKICRKWCRKETYSWYHYLYRQIPKFHLLIEVEIARFFHYLSLVLCFKDTMLVAGRVVLTVKIGHHDLIGHLLWDI
jgi:hypothetical protein